MIDNNCLNCKGRGVKLASDDKIPVNIKPQLPVSEKLIKCQCEPIKSEKSPFFDRDMKKFNYCG